MQPTFGSLLSGICAHKNQEIPRHNDASCTITRMILRIAGFFPRIDLTFSNPKKCLGTQTVTNRDKKNLVGKQLRAQRVNQLIIDSKGLHQKPSSVVLKTFLFGCTGYSLPQDKKK